MRSAKGEGSDMDREKKKTSLAFFLSNPARHYGEVREDCRQVRALVICRLLLLPMFYSGGLALERLNDTHYDSI